jgi:2-phospho-L-lactate guanylyltransferase
MCAAHRQGPEMTNTAVIAVKVTARSKSRLRDALAPGLRKRLVSTLLNGVIDAAAGASRLSEVILVASAHCSVGSSVHVVRDDGRSLNDAYVLGARVAASRGAAAALLLPADLPFVTSEDLDAIVAAAPPGGAALAPDRWGTGTNALYVPLPLSFSLAFGSDSAAQHTTLCRSVGLPLAPVTRRGLAWDLDTPRDLPCVAAEPRYAFLSHASRCVA